MRRVFLLAASLLLCLSVFAQAPNPYTYFDVPTRPFDVTLGLLKNDNSEKPGLAKSSQTVSYCAYRIGGDGYPAKVYYNAANKRQYSVASGVNPATGEKQIIKMLSIPDSLAIYRIDDEEKIITKLPASGMQAVGSMDVKERTDIVTEEDVVSSCDRWCYMKTVVMTEVIEGPVGNTEEKHRRTTYTDLETGIVLCEDEGNVKTYLRNIHLGIPYPEVFELPKGYQMIVRDFSAQLKAQQEWEENTKKGYEQLENLGKSGAQQDIRGKIDEGLLAFGAEEEGEVGAGVHEKFSCGCFWCL